MVGDCGADWFDFKYKSHPNREIKMHAVQFGSVGFKKSSKPNQYGLDWFGWCDLRYNISVPNNFKH
jgi:hypothetical protein